MPIRRHKPTSPGRRRSSVLDFSLLTKKRPEKTLVMIKKRTGGRNNQGHITVRHRGGGTKRLIRLVDFKQFRFNEAATVRAIEYDPNRGAFIALVEYADGTKSYILHAEGMNVGDVVVSSKEKIEAKVGNRMPLECIPQGVTIYNVELEPSKGGVMARGAGTSIQFLGVEGGRALLKMPSGETRTVSKDCLASVGTVGNADHRLVRWGKAGRTRHRGFRPTVRGKAMNPVDHPHGGGEGHNPVGLKHPKTPWGKPALGVKTRNPKKMSKKFIVARRKRKKK